MSRRDLLAAGLGVTAAACRLSRSPLAAPPPTPQLWYWHHSLLNSEGGLQSSLKLIDRARAAGYTGVAFWDVSFAHLTSPGWPDPQGHFLKKAMNYAAANGMKVLAQGGFLGYSNEVLGVNPNWAEGLRVTGARFAVDSSGRALHQIGTAIPIANSGFESGKADWFRRGDRGADVDSLISHSGLVSGAIENAPGNARFSQFLTLTPWRQYHLRLFVRTKGYKGPAPAIEIFDAADSHKVLMYRQLVITPTQDWTQVDFAFNSQSSSRAWLYFGVWGGNSGNLWFDDVSLEETALVFLIRRDGAPLKIYDPATGAVFHEPIDYDPISDPGLTADPRGDYHTPPAVTLPQGTRLKPGQIVAMDFYAAQPVDGHQMGACLTDPDFQEWEAANARQVMQMLPREGGIFLQYDEMRQMNSCESCRAKGLTAGQLLAWRARKSLQLYRSIRSDVALYAWSDMFDPYANAHDNYYLVEGDIAGSWLGLPPEVTIMNWNLDHLRNSLEWFAGLSRKQPVSHRQIIAGYYDNHDGASASANELKQARGIPGVDGLMYTTWEPDYSQLESFADSARRNWPVYVASLAGI